MYNKLNKYLFILLFIGCFIGGFVKNFIGLPRSLPATIPLIFITFYAYYVYLYKNIFTISRTTFLFAIFIVSVFIIFIVDRNPILERVLGIRNFIFYIDIFIVTYILFSNKNNYIKSLIKILGFIFFTVSLFGIIQVVFGKYLPISLLTIKGTSIFGFYGTDIIRPTALIGNTIEFAGVALMSFVYYYLKYFLEKRRDLFTSVALIVSAYAVIISYSRAALVGMVIIVVLFNFIKDKKYGFVTKSSAVLYGILVIFIIFFIFSGSFLTDRFIHPDPSTLGSNVVHYKQTISAIQHIITYPLTGVGIGTQGPSANGNLIIITDGFLFQLLLEYGVIVGCIYFLFIIYIVRYIYKNINIKFMNFPSFFSVISLISFHILGIINSSYMFSSVLIILWFFVGASLVEIRRYKGSSLFQVRRGKIQPSPKIIAMRLRVDR
jgi:hypothetical protein